MPALAGLVTRAAMHRRGLTLREISQVAVKNHAHGARNPYAHFRDPVNQADPGYVPLAAGSARGGVED